MVELPAGLMEAMRLAAREAGDHALRLREEENESTAHKSDKSLVTRGDTEGEAIIRRHLAYYIEEHGFGFLGEETGRSKGSSGFDFVVDPIDGTTNYAHGDPNWVVSIGVTYHGNPIAGVTYQPEIDKLYYAAEGHGAFLEHRGKTKQLRISDTVPKAHVLDLLFARHPSFENQRAINARWFEMIPELTNNTQLGRFRTAGCPSVPLCMMAEGSRQAVIAKPVNLYDVAGSIPIAREAGAHIFLEREGGGPATLEDPLSMVAATKNLFPHVKELYDQTIGRKAQRYHSLSDHSLAERFAADRIKYGVTIGRRQPMHRAHIDCIKEIAAAGLHPVIVIGSVNQAESRFYQPIKNPLDEAQQREQIRRAMDHSGIKDYTVLALKDMGHNEFWASSLAKLLQDNGLKPSECVSHYRSKAADADIGDALAPMSATEEFLNGYGISVWHSVNRDPALDGLSASTFRKTNLMADDMQATLHRDLAAPDFLMFEAKRARAANPDKALLCDLPITTLDLSLRRFREERHLSTAAILQDKKAESLEALEEAMLAALKAPSPEIAGALEAQSTKKGRTV